MCMCVCMYARARARAVRLFLHGPRGASAFVRCGAKRRPLRSLGARTLQPPQHEPFSMQCNILQATRGMLTAAGCRMLFQTRATFCLMPHANHRHFMLHFACCKSSRHTCMPHALCPPPLRPSCRILPAAAFHCAHPAFAVCCTLTAAACHSLHAPCRCIPLRSPCFRSMLHVHCCCMPLAACSLPLHAMRSPCFRSMLHAHCCCMPLAACSLPLHSIALTAACRPTAPVHHLGSRRGWHVRKGAGPARACPWPPCQCGSAPAAPASARAHTHRGTHRRWRPGPLPLLAERRATAGPVCAHAGALAAAPVHMCAKGRAGPGLSTQEHLQQLLCTRVHRDRQRFRPSTVGRPAFLPKGQCTGGPG